jgi:hypothetical protein
VSPFRLFWATAILLLLGTIVFSFRGALVLKTKAAAPLQNSLWRALAVSVVCFLPDKLLPESFANRVPVVPSDVLIIKKIKLRPTLVGTILSVCGWILVPLIILVMGILVAGLVPGKS